MRAWSQEINDRLGNRFDLILTAAWATLVAVWLIDVAAVAVPHLLSRTLAAVAVVLLTLRLLAAVRRLWRGEVAGGRLLLALLAVAFGLCFAGLEHEIGELYFADEGTYLSQARRINGGQLLRPWFVYPHLLFYLDAFALWLAGLAEPLTTAAARLVYGVHEPQAVAVLVTRSVTATFGAATVVPVFLAARRLAGTAAAGFAGALLAVSPIVVGVAHLNISDVPAAFFAALTLHAVIALLERESVRGYVVAGAWAGLAAGSKYPAGLVAVAIVGVYVCHRLRRRGEHRGSAIRLGIFWAGLAALATFLLTTPSLVAFPGSIYAGGGADVLFGVRQYAAGGWAGVVRSNNLLYYLGQLQQSWGVPALLVGVSGVALFCRGVWSRLAWLLPFPLVYGGVIVAMSISVRRNLLPLLPFFAVLLGVGCAGWLAWLLRRWPRRRLPLAAGVAALCLTLPLLRTGVDVVRLIRPTTRELAVAWLDANLPPGAFIVQEQYTPPLGPTWRFPTRQPRFAIRVAIPELRDPQHDFLLLASEAYDRFFKDPALTAPADRYRALFAAFDLVGEIAPGRFRSGPTLRLYRLDPDPPTYADRRTFTADDALLRRKMMRQDDGTLRFTEPWEWSLFKAHLAPGTYRLIVDAEPPVENGRVRVLTRDNAPIAEVTLSDDGARLELPRRDKYFVYVTLPPGGELRRVTVARVGKVGSALAGGAS